MVIAGVVIGFLALVTLGAYRMYRMGQREQRVVALGRETYIRFYPNPGFGIRIGARRVAVSSVGGLEVFRRLPTRDWRRTHAVRSRIARPGGV